VNRWVGKGDAAIPFRILLLLALLLSPAGCHRGIPVGTPPAAPPPRDVPADNAASAAPTEWIPAAVPVVERGHDNDAGATREPEQAEVTGDAADNAAIRSPEVIADAPWPVDPAAAASEAAGKSPEPPDRAGSPSTEEKHPPKSDRGGETSSERKPASEVAPLPMTAFAPKETIEAAPPAWTRSREELVYRVDFIGITMGYARFRYEGKVSIEGKIAYHLNVRAWTSGVLSYIYPINDTIDYYLDTETLAPIRQEFTRTEREKDDVALYDQETGTITYRYRQSGKIRKKVDTLPTVYDPVSVAYYFRWRDLGVEDRPRNVYGGRKLYQISSRVLGKERIRTEHGEVDTIAVQPVIRRDGKLDNKGDLKVWFSGDERRVPVRLYAKFRKIKDWTLVGELMPKAGG
jgi:hypothetical protein